MLKLWLLALGKKAQNVMKIKHNSVFLAYLLMILAGWSRFCFKGLVAILAAN